MLQYKILIVEDESIVAMDLKQRLIAMNYEVTATVSTGVAAIEQVSICLPDLILMDIQIKGDIDGIQVSQIIQKEFEVPIIFLTANSDIATINRAKKTGPLAYILKPFENKGLQTAIEIALYRFQLEQKLKSSESWLQAILKSIGDAVIAADIEGKVAFINSAAEQITGWNSSEAENNDVDLIINFLDEKTEQPIENPIKQYLKNDATVALTKHITLKSRTGEVIPIESNVTLIHNEQEIIIGCVMVFRDVTIIRNAEQKIIGYQEQLKKLLTIRTDELNETTANLNHETNERNKAEEEVIDLTKFPDESPDPIIRISKKGILVYANKASTLLLNSWECGLNRLVPEKWVKIISESLSNGKRLDTEIEVEGRIYSLVIAPIVTSGYVNLYGKDITLQREAEVNKEVLQEQLKKAERMKALGLLAGGVAHDLNNMLGPVLGYSELILKKLSDDNPIRKQIERIGNSASDAAIIIQDLLTLARRGLYEMTPLSLNHVVEEYLESPGFENLTQIYPSIKIKKVLKADIPLVKGSSPHLSKVIMNLIVNAFDAMGDQGILTIETSCSQIDRLNSGYTSVNPGEYSILKIRDTGCGIKPEDMNFIFEPYYSKKKMQSHSGSGLGLSVVYGVVKDHRGYYDITSELGVGTEFTLYFPITHKTITFLEKPKIEIGGQEKILVVDDNESLRELLNDSLSSMGYVVSLAKNGTEAVKIIQEQSFDLILLDMIMEKEFDGLDTYREILNFQPHQKAIIVSGFSCTNRVEEALKLGAGGYVKKPFHIKSLGEIVRKELDNTIQVA